MAILTQSGQALGQFAISNAKYGLTLAAGDVDGDWKDELIVGLGPDPKNLGIFKIFKYQDGALLEIASITAYPDYKYGVAIATGDVDADGRAEIATAPGSGPQNPGLIKIWKFDGTVITSWQSFDASGSLYGATVALGDVNGDRKAEIIVGSGPAPNATATVRVFTADGVFMNEFTAFEDSHSYGCTVASGDLDVDGVCEIIAGLGPGPQNSSTIRIFKSEGTEIHQFSAFEWNYKYGTRISTGNTGR